MLPIPGAEASGSNVLAFRNMLRAKFYWALPRGSGRPCLAGARHHASGLTLGQTSSTARRSGTTSWQRRKAARERVAARARRRTHRRRGLPGRCSTRTERRICTRAFAPLASSRATDGRLTVSDLFQFARVVNPAPLPPRQPASPGGRFVGQCIRNSQEGKKTWQGEPFRLPNQATSLALIALCGAIALSRAAAGTTAKSHRPVKGPT